MLRCFLVLLYLGIALPSWSAPYEVFEENGKVSVPRGRRDSSGSVRAVRVRLQGSVLAREPQGGIKF